MAGILQASKHNVTNLRVYVCEQYEREQKKVSHKSH